MWWVGDVDRDVPGADEATRPGERGGRGEWKKELGSPARGGGTEGRPRQPLVTYTQDLRPGQSGRLARGHTALWQRAGVGRGQLLPNPGSFVHCTRSSIPCESVNPLSIPCSFSHWNASSTPSVPSDLDFPHTGEHSRTCPPDGLFCDGGSGSQLCCLTGHETGARSTEHTACG